MFLHSRGNIFKLYHLVGHTIVSTILDSLGESHTVIEQLVVLVEGCLLLCFATGADIRAKHVRSLDIEHINLPTLHKRILTLALVLEEVYNRLFCRLLGVLIAV